MSPLIFMRTSLNAPYGAPRFLSEAQESDRAPPRAVLMHLYGAPRFLTLDNWGSRHPGGYGVLMHLMVLRAFWRGMQALLEHLEDAGS